MVRTRPSGLPFVFLMGLVIIAALFYMPKLDISIHNASVSIMAVPPIKINGHASEAHGYEADLVRRCFDENGGAHHIWKQPKSAGYSNSDRYHLLCLDKDGYWGDRIIEKIDDTWEEVTAFRVKANVRPDWNTVRMWLERKGCTAVKPANLPW